MKPIDRADRTTEPVRQWLRLDASELADLERWIGEAPTLAELERHERRVTSAWRLEMIAATVHHELARAIADRRGDFARHTRGGSAVRLSPAAVEAIGRPRLMGPSGSSHPFTPNQ